MPWAAKDAKGKTKKARNPKLARQWAAVANRTLRSSGDEGKAIRYANAVVARYRRK